MTQNWFVDTHCHLFNIVDVPMYDTLMGKVEVGTLKRLVGGLGLGAVFAAGLADNLLEKSEDFIRFFERSIEANILWLADQMRAALPPGTRIMITPLVMDFDLIQSQTRGQLNEPKALRQLDRLIEAIQETADSCQNETVHPSPVTICPFMGYDLRKLAHPGALDQLKAAWENYAIPRQQRAQGNIETGKVLGIKLYPPIGFSPYPDGGDGYEAFYTWCAEEGIPITTHCQNASGSYSVGLKKKQVNRLTHARNWWKLFERVPVARNLNVNFAHFGGEDGLEDMIDWTVDKNSWTYFIIKLLKRYDHTYSDISAFDFADKEACRNLVRALEMDAAGEFDDEGDHLLADKLMWGSDVPMILSGEAYTEKGGSEPGYRHFYHRFQETVPADLHEKLTRTNPVAFLGIG